MQFHLQSAGTLDKALANLNRRDGVEVGLGSPGWGRDYTAVRARRDGSVVVRATFRVTGALPREGNRRFGGRGHSGRRINSLCWHGHRDLFREVFKLEPGAKIMSAVATYDGVEDFEATFPDTAYDNVGSYFAPMSRNEACDCVVGW